jgi:methoxymalonate biosynthesis acyl carrier protein
MANGCTSTLEEVSHRIRGFVVSAIDADPLEDDTDFFQSGLVDSLFAMELVVFIEESFSIVVEIDDLELDNFSSIENLAAFVQRKSST